MFRAFSRQAKRIRSPGRRQRARVSIFGHPLKLSLAAAEPDSEQQRQKEAPGSAPALFCQASAVRTVTRLPAASRRRRRSAPQDCARAAEAQVNSFVVLDFVAIPHKSAIQAERGGEDWGRLH